MSVIRWNPLREFDELFAHAAHAQATRQINRQPAGAGAASAATSRASFTPAADIAETDESYFIELELPGFAASDVDVSIHDGVLSVSGERKPAHVRDTALRSAPEQPEAVNAPESVGKDEVSVTDSNAVTALETRRVHRAERAFGKFERRFRLPKDADINAVSATAKNGVLTLEVGRLAETARRAIEIQVA